MFLKLFKLANHKKKEKILADHKIFQNNSADHKIEVLLGNIDSFLKLIGFKHFILEQMFASFFSSWTN